jgi:hypothetical protein
MRGSAPGTDGWLRLAWTLADMADADQPGIDHVTAVLDLCHGEL